MDACQFISRMVKARILNSHLVTRFDTGNNLTSHLDLTVTGLSSNNLIDALSCSISQTYDIATHGEVYCIAIISIHGNALCRETCIRCGISTQYRTSQGNSSYSLRSKGVVKTILAIKIIKYVKLRIDILHRELSIYRIATAPRSNSRQVVLINNNIRFDVCSLLTNSYNKCASILRPNSSPVSATYEIVLCSATVVVDMYGVVSNKYNGCTSTNSSQQFVLYLNDRVVLLTI